MQVIGLPIRSGFEPSKDKAEYKTDLNLDPSKPNVLIVGGGDGMGGIVETGESAVRTGRNARNEERSDELGIRQDEIYVEYRRFTPR